MPGITSYSRVIEAILRRQERERDLLAQARQDQDKASEEAIDRGPAASDEHKQVGMMYTPFLYIGSNQRMWHYPTEKLCQLAGRVSSTQQVNRCIMRQLALDYSE